MSALAPAKDWWDQASSRDQLSIIACGLVLTVYLLYIAILNPVQNMAEEQMKKTAAQKVALERVRKLAAQVKEMKRGNSNKKSRSAEKIVESSISTHGLRVSGFDASGKSGIRVRFDQVTFDKLLAWINELEVNEGLSMKDISIASGKAQGVVSANLLIQGG